MILKGRERDHRIPREENPHTVRDETSLHSVEKEGGMNENDREAEREGTIVLHNKIYANIEKTTKYRITL